MSEDVVESNRSESTEDTDSTAAISYARPDTPHVNLASAVTRGDVAALAVRILGIYMVALALPAIGFVLGWIAGPIKWGSQVEFYVLYELVFLGGGMAMIIKGGVIGKWLLPTATMSPDALAVPESPHALQALAFSVVGVVLVVTAFPSLANLVAESANGGHAYPVQFLKPGLEFVLGLLLFFRGKRLATFWQGLPATAPVRPNDDSGPL